jgi:response regulator of citrate/malate metabolism
VIEVLVVDDDFMVAKLHCGFVDRTPGFTVVGAAHTGSDGLRAARELQPDLVLLDIYLPDMTGLDVLHQLRHEAPEVDVLVITAAREADTVRQALRGGIVHYLIKPFAYDDLRERLDHYATAHRGLGGSHPAEQADVDRIFGAGATGTTAQLPKGLSSETAQLVEEALRGSGTTLSAAECAERVGLSRVSARRYLEYFVAVGRAEVQLKYGGSGRPERRYSWRQVDT